MWTEPTPQQPLRHFGIRALAGIGLAASLVLLPSSCADEEPTPPATRTPVLATDSLNIPIEAYAGFEASESVKRSQSNFDAARAGWFTEAVAESAKEELHLFIDKVASPQRNLRIQQHVTQEFTGSTAWRPSQLKETFDDGTLRIQRAAEYSTESFSRDALNEASEDLLSVFGWSEDERRNAGIALHTKSKIFETHRVPGQPTLVETKAIVRLDGPTKSGDSLLVDMIWNIQWLVRNGSKEREITTQIRAIELDSYTQVLNREETLFAEVTGHVFKNVPRFDDEFRIGTSAYHHHIDLMDENIFAGQIGIAVGDVDEDGLEDLFIPQQGGHPNRLLKHLPDGTLKDISEESGLNLLEGCQSALILDFDNDGHADIAMARHNLLVVGYGDGTGKFELIRPVSVGLDKIKSLAAADWDQDGDLDIYACMYSKEGPLGTIPVPYQDATNGPPNVAWLNTPDKERPRERWTDVTAEIGLDQNNNKFSYGASFEDFDGDGDLDLYVANDFGSNNLYRNENGHFRDVALEVGAADMAAGMGVSIGDVDMDGDFDIYVTNMWSSAGRRVTTQADRFMPGRSEERNSQLERHARGNTLLLNDGKGNFLDGTEASGAMNGGWAWGAMLVDINNNGLLDIYSPNGFITGKKAADT